MLTEIGFSRQVVELQFLNQYFYISFYFYTFFVRTFSWFWNKNDKLLAFSFKLFQIIIVSIKYKKVTSIIDSSRCNLNNKMLSDPPPLTSHQRAQEEVHSKELKVKLLTDSVNSFIAKAPPTAHDALRSELDVLTANYQRLCSRLDGKCKTLEVS